MRFEREVASPPAVAPLNVQLVIPIGKSEIIQLEFGIITFSITPHENGIISFRSRDNNRCGIEFSNCKCWILPHEVAKVAIILGIHMADIDDIANRQEALKAVVA